MRGRFFRRQTVSRALGCAIRVLLPLGAFFSGGVVLAEKAPTVLAISQFVDQVEGERDRVRLKAIRDQVVSRLVQEYDCTLLTRSNGYLMSIENALSKYGNKGYENSVELPQAEVAIYGFLEVVGEGAARRQDVKLGSLLQLLNLDSTQPSELELSEKVLANHESYSEQIAEQIATLFDLPKKREILVREGTAEEVWAILPLKRFYSVKKGESRDEADLRLRMELALAESEKVSTLVDRSMIDDVLLELNIQSMDRSTEGTASVIGRLVGADRVVMGVVGESTPSSDQLRVDLILVDGPSGVVLDAVAGESQRRALKDLVGELIVELAAREQVVPQLAPASVESREREFRKTLGIVSKLDYFSGAVVEAGLDMLQSAYSLFPNDLNHRYRVASALNGQVILSLSKKMSVEEKDRSIEFLLQVLNGIEPQGTSRRPWLLKGHGNLETGRYEEAIEAGMMHLAMNSDPDIVTANRIICDSLYRLGQYEEALEYLPLADQYQKGIRLGCRIYGKLGDRENELKYLEKLEGHSSSYPDLAARNLELLRELRGPEAALDRVKDYHGWAASRREVQLEVGLSYLDLEQFDRAAEVLSGLESMDRGRPHDAWKVPEVKAKMERLRNEVGNHALSWRKLAEVVEIPDGYYITVQPIGDPDIGMIQNAIPKVEEFFGIPIRLLPAVPIPFSSLAYSENRNQHNGDEVVAHYFRKSNTPEGEIMSILVTERDIFLPGYRFVYAIYPYEWGFLMSYYRWFGAGSSFVMTDMISKSISSSFERSYGTRYVNRSFLQRTIRYWESCKNSGCVMRSSGTAYTLRDVKYALCLDCQERAEGVDWDQVYTNWQQRVPSKPRYSAEQRKEIEEYDTLLKSSRQLAEVERRERELALEFLEPISIPESRPGIRFETFEFEPGSVQSVSDLDSLQVVSEGVVESMELGVAPRRNNFGVVFEGFLEVPEDGEYMFFVASDDGGVLSVHGREVVKNDGKHAMVWENGKVALKAGYHPLTLEYFDSGGDVDLEVYVRGPGMIGQQVSAENMVTPHQ